jgi:hypothetical protein
MTLDELIKQLEEKKEQLGGTAIVGIDDADTGWPLHIEEINKVSGNLLLVSGSYRNEVK